MRDDEGIIDLESNDTYILSVVRLAEKTLSGYDNVESIKPDEDRLNEYDNISLIGTPKDVFSFDAGSMAKSQLERAKRCVLEGRFFSEHAAAGEAVRLGLGTKYLINIQKDLSAERIAKLISEEKGAYFSPDEVTHEAGCRPEQLYDMDLGTRHMAQYSFDISKLAQEHNMDPQAVLGKQKMLIVLNETSAEKIIISIKAHGFFGFSRKNVMFMVQNSYHGISIMKDSDGKKRFVYDIKSPRRLHNHGQMVMQETMDDQIFFINGDGSRRYLKSAEFVAILETMDDKLSYNIEDLSYLIGSIDYESLALALSKSDEGYRMTMEIVGNNPKNPQKGGMAAYDQKLGRNVMIESFQLNGIKNSDIEFLNKNFNHYPKPAQSWKLLKKKGLNMPISIKNQHIYYNPVQGDINFLVNTLFLQRKVLKPIQSWKSPATSPLAMSYMHKQDRQPGFLEYARKFSAGGC